MLPNLLPWSRIDEPAGPKGQLSRLGGMRERPNRTVSKTVVGLAHRGFKSHSLRAGPSALGPYETKGSSVTKLACGTRVGGGSVVGVRGPILVEV
jgi:hypothetical protein